MNATTAILGTIASIVGIIAFFFPSIGPKLFQRLPLFPRYNWDNVLVKVEEAQQRVYILQTWFPTLRLELSRWKTAINREGVEFKILIADQSLVPFRLRTREAVSGLTIQNVEDIRGFISSLSVDKRSRLHVRFFSAIPFGPIYVIDNYIYWGLYLSHIDSMRGPSFRTRANSKLGQQVLASFDALWQNSSSRSGALSFQDAHKDRKVDHLGEIIRFIELRANLNKCYSISYDTKEALMTGSRFICFLRHGETDLNLSDIITGSLAVGVNAAARENIENFKREVSRVNWGRVFSSPNRRCTETLISLIPDTKDRIEIREELKERQMGDLEGFSRKTCARSLPQYKGQDILHSFHGSANGGEAYCDVIKRTYDFICENLKSPEEAMPILVCTHDTTIRSIIYLMTEIESDNISEIDVSFVEPVYLIFK